MKNKNRTKVIMLTAGIVLVFFITNYNVFHNQVNNNEGNKIQDKNNLGRLKISDLYIESFIHVDNNWSETEATYDWCNGDGSWHNPYVIENVIINASGSPTGCGIFINNSKNDYFIIRYCSVYDAERILWYGAGIKLENANNGTLTNNDCSNNGWSGILLINNCYNNSILANIANYNGEFGIGLTYNSDDNIIIGNTANNNGQRGIWVERGSENNFISRNTLNDNAYGIYLWVSCNNNIISGNTINYNYRGIFFQQNCNNNIISNNTVNENTLTGIYLYLNSINNLITENTINSNDEGISLEDDCDNNIINVNLIENNQNYGIRIRNTNCEYNLIYQNSLIGTIGRHASDSGMNNQWDNSIIGNFWDNHTTPDTDNNGIVDIPYTWIAGNSASIDHFPLTEMPIYLGEKIHIDDSGVNALNWNATATVKVWCTGLGTFSDPYVIEGLEIDGGGLGNDILIENSNVYFIIRSCTLYRGQAAVYLNNVYNGMIIENDLPDNDYGIRLDYSSYNKIIGNDFYGNMYGTGINLYYSSNNIIEGNFVENHYQGIRLDSECFENTILGNTANNNSNYGILLLYGSEYNDVTENIVMNQNYYSGILVHVSDHNTILENTVHNNPLYGIFLDGSSNNLLSGNFVFINGLDGITIRSEYTTVISTGNNITMNAIYNNKQNGITLDDDCNITTIFDNDIYGNDMSGIVFAHSSFDICYGNVIHDNAEMGIYVEINSENNLFYENTFIGNSINALDNGSNNNWDNGLIGNYWDDYPSVDANDNGIGDIPYIISGTANSQDNFPIWEDGIDMIFLFVEICDQKFSEESFNITFYIYNGINEGIDFATIQMWWNGVDVSTSIQNIGGGLYFISLEPITVTIGEDPILLNMSIVAISYPDKYFETYITVDPDTLDKGGGEIAEEFPLPIIIIAIASAVGGIGVAGVSIFLLRKRKRGREIK